MMAPIFDGSFPHSWTAEVLTNRPMIFPPRHFTYPAIAEEVEKGAMEVLVRPGSDGAEESFLATCALGFRDAAAPSGLWSTPDPDWICAVSGGYAYLIDVRNPERFIMLPYRPVLEVLPLVAHELLLFVGHHAILAWGRAGEAWQSDRLSWEGISITGVEDGILRGTGWDMITDKDVPFALDIQTGQRVTR
jgi:hypothetical protein